MFACLREEKKKDPYRHYASDDHVRREYPLKVRFLGSGFPRLSNRSKLCFNLELNRASSVAVWCVSTNKYRAMKKARERGGGEVGEYLPLS